ncbi:hypothetical protein QVH35_00045 [Candidatus Nitrosotenuis chungbukensis]|nr:hypothetical protein [Candidatus Nitrosotenuis chungbukensis]WKT57984.1 hypothetical protein QVH35_00045 [Candidatus Nitrosotenuis chungbukensis]
MSKDNTYNSVFAKKLSEVGLLLDNGISPTESVKATDFRSHFTKMSFYLLAYIAEFGGGNPKNLETVNAFITNAKNTVKEGTSAISALAIIVFAAPVIMVFTASMIQNITGSIDTNIGSTIKDAAESSLGQNTNFVNLVTITPEFISMIKTLIVTSSILGAFVITKAIDFTFYNTWRVVAIGIISLVSIMYLDGIASVNFDSFLGNLSFK